MNREELKRHIAEAYAADPEFPWVTHPGNMVFRHSNNKRWFALVMEVPREKLGLPGDGALDILNVKCDPVMAGSFRAEAGIFPAYHMSKANWISVALDGTVSGERIRLLLAMSFDLTASKAGRGRRAPRGRGE